MATCPVVWADSFMTYDQAHFKDWYLTAGNPQPVINNSNGRGGRGSIVWGGSVGVGPQWIATASYSTWIVSQAIYGLFSNNNDFHLGGCAVGCNSDGTLSVYRGINLGVNLLGSTTAHLVSGAWNHVAVRIYTHATAGTVDVWFNESLVLSLTAQNTGSSSVNAVEWSGGGLQTCDLVIQASNTSTDTPVGDRAVTALMPNGAGFYTGYSVSGAATNWQAVSEVPPNDDTSYVYSSTATTKDSYTIADLPAATASVDAVVLKRVADKTDAGTRAEASLVRISGTDYIGAGQNLSTSYSGYYHVYDVSPATSSAWGVSEVNGMEIGHEVSA